METLDRLWETLGYAERLRIGDQRAQLQLGEESLIRNEGGNSYPPVSVMIRVTNLNSHIQHAPGVGTKIVQLPADYPYSERRYTAEDIGGQPWTFSQTTADRDPAIWGGMQLLD